MKKFILHEKEDYYRGEVFPKMKRKELENMILVLLYRLDKVKKHAEIYLNKVEEVRIKRICKSKDEHIKKV